MSYRRELVDKILYLIRDESEDIIWIDILIEIQKLLPKAFKDVDDLITPDILHAQRTSKKKYDFIDSEIGQLYIQFEYQMTYSRYIEICLTTEQLEYLVLKYIL